MTRRRIIPRSRRDAGMAMIVAAALMGFLALALTAATVFMTTQMRRTQRAGVEAQLRQLLLAGSAAAPALLDDATDRTVHDVPLPDPLVDAGARLRLTLEPVAADARRVTVEAVLDDTEAQQVLEYRRTAEETWRVVTAELTPAG